MYAVIETGGKQYRATPGEFLEIESIAGEIGAEIEFNKVLGLFDGESVKAGSDVGSALVKGTIIANGRGAKTIVFKFKRKKQYRRTQGHRQAFTRIKISEIA
jgi:large subunit ribosomal protein L21